MKLILPTLKFLLLFSVLTVGLNAQPRKQEKVTLDLTKPGVYIEFGRIGEGEQLRINDSKERVWLKLVNNTKWSIYLWKFNIGEEDEVGLYYEVEREVASETEIPEGYKPTDARSPFSELKSGNSINFSVPRNHLAKDLKIRIDINFEWENLKELSRYPFSMPTYSVYFSASDLEEYLKIKESVSGKAISLPRPPFPSFNGKTGNKLTVLVQAEIDENGNVTSAKAISGHPLLRSVCETAARNSKFSQTKILGIPVKAKAILVYEYILGDEVTMNIKIKSIEAIKPRSEFKL